MWGEGETSLDTNEVSVGLKTRLSPLRGFADYEIHKSVWMQNNKTRIQSGKYNWFFFFVTF